MPPTRKRHRPKPQAPSLKPKIAALMGDCAIDHVALKDLHPAPYNPRIDLQPGDPEYEKLKRSLEHFGYVEKVVWNRATGHIVGGHQRLKVMTLEWKLRSDDLIDVLVVDLSPVREKALNIALNKIEGGWDDGKLAEVLAELQQDGSIDAAIAGFDADEIQAVFDRAAHDLGLSPGSDPGSDPGSESHGQGGGEGSGGEDTIKDTYGVMVTCKGEAQQRDLHDRLRAEGYKVRLMVL